MISNSAMISKRRCIWFWQTEVTPHIAGLAAKLASLDCEVVYVANQRVSSNRAMQGWVQPDLGTARLELAPTVQSVRALSEVAPLDSIHISQGFRGNGLIGEAQHALVRRGLRQWVVMETVEDANWSGVLKRIEYSRVVRRMRPNLQGVLATGHRTPDWIAARGMPADRIFPFTYFLRDFESRLPVLRTMGGRYRFVFVGQFIHLKRLDFLVDAIKKLNNFDIELTVIGSGPLEEEWCSMTEAALPGRVNWLGKLAMNEVRTHMAAADCLVLPSLYDGWGAVVTEALMVGTPAICSDTCGVASVVQRSGYGGVFRVGDRGALVNCLEMMVLRGKLNNQARYELASWARCLGADAGADYLLRILSYSDGLEKRPLPPWEHPVTHI